MSYAGEVNTVGDAWGVFTGNGLRFATEKEAWGYVSDLRRRWTAVVETRVVESEDPVNYTWEDGLRRLTDKETGRSHVPPHRVKIG